MRKNSSCSKPSLKTWLEYLQSSIFCWAGLGLGQSSGQTARNFLKDVAAVMLSGSSFHSLEVRGKSEL